MVESSYDPDSHSCLHPLDVIVGTLVAADIPVEDSVHALGLVRPQPYEKFSWFLNAGL